MNSEKRTKIAIGDGGVLVSMPRDVGKRSLIFERLGCQGMMAMPKKNMTKDVFFQRSFFK